MLTILFRALFVGIIAMIACELGYRANKCEEPTKKDVEFPSKMSGVIISDQKDRSDDDMLPSAIRVMVSSGHEFGALYNNTGFKKKCPSFKKGWKVDIVRWNGRYYVPYDCPTTP